MSLVREQDIFLQHVSELIRKAHELGLLISGGELYRTPEQQALYVQNGRSKTLDSQHLKRLAIDLNFFVETENGDRRLTYDVETIRPLGEFWESLDDANRWGGNWTTLKDTPHFERRESSASAKPISEGPKAAAPAGPKKGKGLLVSSVGYQRPNDRDDVETVQRLLNANIDLNGFQLSDGPLTPNGKCCPRTLAAIMEFQRSVVGVAEPDGKVDPDRQTIARLCEVVPQKADAAFLALLYLGAFEKDIAELAPGIEQVMRERAINTPLRQAHFLAQIGHESGELHYREELASGEAYEGRATLGNTQPGDGKRFKGRGLIQLTGRANYAAYGRNIERESELLENPSLVAADTILCVDVAGWYWTSRKLNDLADADDFDQITVKINGRGRNGYQNRKRLLKRAKALFAL